MSILNMHLIQCQLYDKRISLYLVIKTGNISICYIVSFATYSITVKKLSISVSLYCCHQTITWWSPRYLTINRKQSSISFISKDCNLSHLGDDCVMFKMRRECLFLSSVSFSGNSLIPITITVSWKMLDWNALDVGILGDALERQCIRLDTDAGIFIYQSLIHNGNKVSGIPQMHRWFYIDEWVSRWRVSLRNIKTSLWFSTN